MLTGSVEKSSRLFADSGIARVGINSAWDTIDSLHRRQAERDSRAMQALSGAVAGANRLFNDFGIRQVGSSASNAIDMVNRQQSQRNARTFRAVMPSSAIVQGTSWLGLLAIGRVASANAAWESIGQLNRREAERSARALRAVIPSISAMSKSSSVGLFGLGRVGGHTAWDSIGQFNHQQAERNARTLRILMQVLGPNAAHVAEERSVPDDVDRLTNLTEALSAAEPAGQRRRLTPIQKAEAVAHLLNLAAALHTLAAARAADDHLAAAIAVAELAGTIFWLAVLVASLLADD